MNRYDSYKDSGVEWIGEIPKHWINSRLKYVSEIVTGNTPPTKDEDNYEGGEFLWVKPNEINGLIPTNDTKQKLTIKGRSLSRVLPPFSVLVNGIGRIGVFGFSELPVSTNQQINSIVFNDKVDNRYGIFHVSMMKEGFLSNSEKVVVPILNKTKQENLEFILPPISEQQQIVSFLDDKTQKIDFLIQQKERKVKLLKEKTTSLIKHVVTKGINTNGEMKNSGVEWIGDIPRHWKMKKVKYLFEIRKRISGELGYDVLSVTQKGLKVKDIISGKGQVSMDYTKYQIVNKDDFVMNHMDLLTGYVDVSKQLGVTSPDYRVFTLTDEKSNKDYYLSIFQFGYKNKIFYGSGQGSSMLGRWRLPSRPFNEFKFPYPPMKEQQQIVEYLDKQTEEIDTLIQLEQKKIDTLKEYRQSFISEVVTGRIRVCEEDNSLSLNSQIV